MATDLKSVAELQEIYNNEVDANSNELTDFNVGSINDVEGGAACTAVHEAMALIIDRFRKTFFDSADGPEVTLGFDDLEFLAVDHFGELFARPEAQKAIGIVTFSRPTSAAGNVSILAGTVIKTHADASGQEQRFRTIADVLMTGLSINASIEAIVAGSEGNIDEDLAVVIESTLTDATIVVTNALPFAGGSPVMNDSNYRQFIRNLIETIKGATIAAIEAAAKTVSGVVTANILEIEKVVKEYDIATDTVSGSYFRIPYPTLYIADANGTASQALIDAVKARIETVRACGVRILVAAASAFELDWTGEITLNPSGPNFAELSVDPSPIVDTMRDYLAKLLVGTGFDVSDANLAMLAIWGPAGTDDLTDFSTVIPGGNVAAVPAVKIVPGTVKVGSC